MAKVKIPSSNVCVLGTRTGTGTGARNATDRLSQSSESVILDSFDTTLSCVFRTSVSDRKYDQMSGASVRWWLKVGGADTKVHSNGSGEEGETGVVTVYCWGAPLHLESN